MASPPPTSTRSITLGPGDSIILPQGVDITSLITDGSISISSTCNNLPQPTAYACGSFTIVIDVDNNDSHPMDEQNTYYQTLKVGNTSYDLSGILVIAVGEDPGTFTVASVLNTRITDQALFTFTDISRTDLFDKRQYITLSFKAPLDLFPDLDLSLYDRGIMPHYKATQIDC